VPENTPEESAVKVVRFDEDGVEIPGDIIEEEEVLEN